MVGAHHSDSIAAAADRLRGHRCGDAANPVMFDHLFENVIRLGGEIELLLGEHVARGCAGHAGKQCFGVPDPLPTATVRLKPSIRCSFGVRSGHCRIPVRSRLAISPPEVIAYINWAQFSGGRSISGGGRASGPGRLCPFWSARQARVLPALLSFGYRRGASTGLAGAVAAFTDLGFSISRSALWIWSPRLSHKSS